MRLINVSLILGVLSLGRGAASQEDQHLRFTKAAEDCRASALELFGSVPAIVTPERCPKRKISPPAHYPKCQEPVVAKSRIWIGEVLVGPDGNVARVWTVRELEFDPPCPEFGEAVLENVRAVSYEPFLVDGEAKPFCMTMTVAVHVE